MVVKIRVPFLGPYYNTAPIIAGTQNGTIILTTTHLGCWALESGFRALGSSVGLSDFGLYLESPLKFRFLVIASFMVRIL